MTVSAVEERISASEAAERHSADRRLHDATREFARESRARSWWHVGSTFALLAASVVAAALARWWGLQLAASVVAAGLFVRAFVLYHDYMHGSILPGSKLGRAIFYVYATFHLAPPRSWRESHNFHHANVGKIDGSEIGSFPLMTVDMWRAASPGQRLAYRLTHHPLTIVSAYATICVLSVCLLPLLKSPAKHWDSALSLLAHGAWVTSLWVFGGFDVALFAVILPMAISAAVGGYLFRAQHLYGEMQVLRESDWTRRRAALASSSYLRMGGVMNWFTGNIGYHHVHHVNPLIPFYRLPRAMAAIPALQDPSVTTLHPREIVASFRANVWDPERGCAVRYRDL